MTPRQCAAARALLGWSQSDLALAAEVAVSTVADFERSARTPIAVNLHRLFSALYRAGARLLVDGVYLTKAKGKEDVL